MRRLALPGYGLVGRAVSRVAQCPGVIVRRMLAEDYGGSLAPVTGPDRHARGAGDRQQARVQA